MAVVHFARGAAVEWAAANPLGLVASKSESDVLTVHRACDAPSFMLSAEPVVAAVLLDEMLEWAEETDGRGARLCTSCFNS
jgi:hypothetical protein